MGLKKTFLREDEAVKELPRPEDFEERLQQLSDGGVLSHGGTTSYYQLTTRKMVI